MTMAPEQLPASGAPASDGDLTRLLARIVPALQPERVYLFGSRARGDHRPDSDYDLLAVVPDDMPVERIRMTETYRLNRDTGIPADIFACHRRWFEANKDQVGTLAYKAAHEGVVVHG
ncbi:MAG: nucleotidyltransferase domain-containing protein [Pseudomonadota bacterium]